MAGDPYQGHRDKKQGQADLGLGNNSTLCAILQLIYLIYPVLYELIL